MRSLALCAALSLAGCPRPPRSVASHDAAVAARTNAPQDAAPPDAALATRSDATGTLRPPVRCAIDGADHVLGAMPLTRLRVAAHEREAMLVAEYVSSSAPEPAGDAVDKHAWRWWRFDLQSPSQRDAPRGQSDPLGVQTEPADPEDDADLCRYASWDADIARPVWEGDRWARWRHASAWGGPACSPCGSLVARLGEPRARITRTTTKTDTPLELEVSSDRASPFGAAIVQRYDYHGPIDDEHDECSESSIVLLWRAPSATGFTERALARWPPRDPRAAEQVAVASNGRERVIVTKSAGPEARIELRRVSADGRVLGAPIPLHSAAHITALGAAFLDDTLVLVWNERAALTAASPSTVRWTQLDPARPESISPAQTLIDRRPLSVDELSLASDGATLALTWVEKPARSTGTTLRIAAGSSIAQWREQVSAGGVELFRTTQPGSIYRTSTAVDRDRLWVAFDEPLRGYDRRPRVRSLRCEPAPSP